MAGITNFWKSVNFRLNQALNFVLERFDDELPTEDWEEGQLAYMDGTVYYHDSARWRALGEGTSSSSSESDTLVFGFTGTASETWVVNHGLGRYVTVQTLDAEGHEVFGTVTWDVDTLNSVTVTFTEPTQGYVIIGYGLQTSQVAWSFQNLQVWTVNHNLGRLVTVQTLDSEGQEITGTVEWDLNELNEVTITFTEPMSGTAIII